MTEFELDCLERKRLARQAKYRKRGSKSKQCSLPSDRLSPREWRERNSKVEMHNVTAPMKWELFKQLDNASKNEYINYLVDNYGVNFTALGELFGVSSRTVQTHTTGLEAISSFQRGHSMSLRQREAWKRFLSMESDELEATECRQETVKEERNKSANSNEMVMNGITISFSGALNVELIAEQLRNLIGDGANGSLEISFRFTQLRY